MNIAAIKIPLLVALLFLISGITTAVPVQKQMPPMFSVQSDPEDILRNYPLGSINMQEAFAHHGGPVRKLMLPNGNRGWLYVTGEEAGIPNIYVLEFSKDGIVVDVLHKSLHYKNGHTALQYQFLQKVTLEPVMTGPGPGK
jgi:hypothetical protein